MGLDVAKIRHAVAIAYDGRQGEIRFIGNIGADPTSVRRLVGRLEKRHARLHFHYEAGSTGYGRVDSLAPATGAVLLQYSFTWKQLSAVAGLRWPPNPRTKWLIIERSELEGHYDEGRFPGLHLRNQRSRSAIDMPQPPLRV